MGSLPNVDSGLDKLLEANWTTPVGAETLLHGGHQILQVFGKILMFIAKQVNL